MSEDFDPTLSSTAEKVHYSSTAASKLEPKAAYDKAQQKVHYLDSHRSAQEPDVQEKKEPTENSIMNNFQQFLIATSLTVAATIIGLFALIIPIIMWSVDAKVEKLDAKIEAGQGKLEAKIEAGQTENREQLKTLSTRLDELDKRYTIQQTYYEKVIDERTKK